MIIQSNSIVYFLALPLEFLIEVLSYLIFFVVIFIWFISKLDGIYYRKEIYQNYQIFIFLIVSEYIKICAIWLVRNTGNSKELRFAKNSSCIEPKNCVKKDN